MTPDRKEPSKPLAPDVSPPDALPGLPPIVEMQPRPPRPSPSLTGHLHPASLIFGTLRIVRRYLIPAVILIYFGNNLVIAIAFIIFVLPAVILSFIRYFFFTYRIENGELIIRDGLVRRTVRHIPLERVQDLRIEQSFLQRLFGVVEANVETAGGIGVEATLSVLSRERVEELRAAIFHEIRPEFAGDRSAASRKEADDSREILRRVHVLEIVLASLSHRRIGLAMVLSIGTLSVIGVDNVVGFSPAVVERGMDYLFQQIGPLSEPAGAANPANAAVVATAGFLLFVVVGMLLSMLWSVLIFYGFELSRIGEDLQRVHGLITRRAHSLPRHRIQILEIEEDLLMRLMQFATLRASTAGSTADRARLSGRDVLLPVLPRLEVTRILAALFPDLQPGNAAWHRVSPIAIRRGTIKGALAMAIISAALYLRLSPATVWFLALLPLVLVYNVVQYRRLGYALDDNYFRTCRGWLNRLTCIVPIRNIQGVSVFQNPMDRRLGLAQIAIHTAGHGYTGGTPHVANLPIGDARALAGELARRTAAMRYRW